MATTALTRYLIYCCVITSSQVTYNLWLQVHVRMYSTCAHANVSPYLVLHLALPFVPPVCMRLELSFLPFVPPVYKARLVLPTLYVSCVQG